MSKQFMVINMGWEQKPLVQKILERGFDVVGVHFEEPSIKRQKLHDFMMTDLRNLEDILEFAQKNDPDAVISDQCDYSWFATALVSEVLNLPGPPIRQGQITTNKIIQRQLADDHDIRQPEFHPVKTPEEAREKAEKIGFPVIVKPIDNRGSFGVNQVDSNEELDSAFYDAIIHSPSRTALVEQFIEGTHVTIDGYCFPESGHQSLTFATKELLEGQRQVAVDIIYPGEIPKKIREKAKNINNKVVDALDLNFGMTHAEYMVTSNGECYLIEIANRGGGCFTSTYMVPAISGIDITDQLILDCLNENRDLYDEKNGQTQRSAYLKFFTLEPGVIRHISGLGEAESVPGVKKLRLNVSEGDEVTETTTDANRHGFIISSGQTRDESRKIAQQAWNKVVVSYE